MTIWSVACQGLLYSTISQSLLKSCPLSPWCYLTILSPATPFSFCLHSFPTLGCFPMSWLFISGSQSIRASTSTTVLPMIIWGWFPLGLTDLTPLQCKGLSRVFSSTTIWKHQFFNAQSSFWSNSHICTWPLEKPELWLDGPLSAKWRRNSKSKSCVLEPQKELQPGPRTWA